MSDERENPEAVSDDGVTDDQNYDALSDEDFMSQAFAAEAAIGANAEPEPEDEPQGGVLEDRLGGPAGSQEEPGGEDEGDEGEDGEEGEKPAAAAPKDGADPKTPEDGAQQPADAAAKDKADGTKPEPTPHHTTPKPDSQAKPAEGDKPAAKAEEAPNYEELYKEVMKPFKANGREFAPRDPAEAVRLMQMGANYTKKMQALKPNLRLMRMLENKELLSEEKLNFLIDLDQKNPEAIRKLLKDSNVDPLDLDLQSETAYKPGNHSISEQEHTFQETLGDVMSTPKGPETVRLINDEWDDASKQAVYQEPQVLQIIAEQRENGIFDTITAEVDRRRMLGDLQNVPFLHAYKLVGDELFKAQSLGPTGASQTETTPARQPQTEALETRAATPAKPMSNGDKARAAGSAPRTPNTPKPDFNPFSMSDDEIMAMAPPKA